MSGRTSGAPEPLWLKNGPTFPFDLCFDFGNARVLFLRAGALLPGSAGLIGRLAAKGRRQEQYDLVEGLSIEERAKAGNGGVVVPFDSVTKLTLGKSWGRPPCLVILADLSSDEAPSQGGSRYIRKHEFPLSSERQLQAEQVRQIRLVLPLSRLGSKFEDRLG